MTREWRQIAHGFQISVPGQLLHLFVWVPACPVAVVAVAAVVAVVAAVDAATPKEAWNTKSQTMASNAKPQKLIWSLDSKYNSAVKPNTVHRSIRVRTTTRS